MYKLKTIFIPLAPTTSTSSSSSPSPLDDGITNSQALHLCPHPKTQGLMPPPRNTTSTGRTTSNVPTVSTPAPVLNRCCPEVCGYCSRSNSYTQGSQVSFYAGNSEEDLEGGIQRTYKLPLQLGQH